MCIPHIGYPAHGDSKCEARGRSRHESNSKRVVRNLEEKKAGTREKSPKQGLASAFPRNAPNNEKLVKVVNRETSSVKERNFK